MTAPEPDGNESCVNQDYRVDLDTYRGPMDLLLHLVKEDELSVHQVPIASVVDQFLGFLERAEAPDLDTAGEFLVLASTLMRMKAAALLPRETVDLEEAIDPAGDLVRQLLAYRRFRGFAECLQARALCRARLRARPARPAPEPDETVERPLEELALFDLARAYGRLLRETLAASEPAVLGIDLRPVGDYMEWVARRMGASGKITFGELRETVRDRSEVVGLFLAVLELLRLGEVEVVQEEIFGEMEIRTVPPERRIRETEAASASNDTGPSREREET